MCRDVSGVKAKVRKRRGRDVKRSCNEGQRHGGPGAVVERVSDGSVGGSTFETETKVWTGQATGCGRYDGEKVVCHKCNFSGYQR